MARDVKKEWLVLLNPHAGGGKGRHDKQKIQELLNQQGFEFKLVTSNFQCHAIKLAKDMVGQGYRKIIVAGGDGTLNEVVNGVFLQEAVQPEKVKIGMLPVGTGNDWIKTFGIPENYAEALEIIKADKCILQDVGKITFAIKRKQRVRFFANMAGFGFDAMVAAKANKLKEKGRSGLLVYLYSLLASYLQYQVCRTRIFVGDTEINDLVFTASIGIGKFNGGGMMQAPEAVPNNGMFQVTVIRKIGLWGILTNLRGLYSGQFVKDRRVSTYTTDRVLISGATKIPGEADGETLGNSAYEIEILPAKLQVIYGNDKYLVHTHEPQLEAKQEVLAGGIS
ncbi:MAG TPA: lipid kinase [Bacteroidales bacterium]|jgi:YegS/Rv2252/BmrU family lipid kinase|nr:lipid kinase [Bacteroidales bacterium]